MSQEETGSIPAAEDEKDSEQGSGEGDGEETPSALPQDAAAWRSLVAALPTRDLFRIIQKDRILSTHLFAGFRPSVEMLRHPVVVSRLVEGAQRSQPLAEALVALNSAVEAVSAMPLTETTVSQPTQKVQTTPPESFTILTDKSTEMAGDGGLKDTLKKQKAALKEKEARLVELTTRVTLLQKERDAARAETDTARAAARAAKEEAERERRLREREARRGKEAESKEQGKENAAKAKTVEPGTLTAARLPVAAPPPLPIMDAVQRLVNRGRYAVVVEVCREALGTDAAISHAGNRGRVHSLLAAALYGAGDIAGGEEQDRLAANALLDGGEIAAAAESLARYFTQLAYFAPGSPVRQSDAATLRRLLLLAERDGLALAVQEVFNRMRIGSAEAGRRLRATLAVGGKKGGALAAAAFGNTSEGNVVLGPDEPVALPTTSAQAATVTARYLTQAVDAGDAALVLQAREGIIALRNRGGKEGQLADSLLEAVTAVEAVAVAPFLAKSLSPVLVDASNVARHNPDPLALTPPPRVGHLLMMRDFLLRQGFFPVLMLADATLRFHVDNRPGYQNLVERGIIRETAPGTSADETLLTEARARRAPLISNDRFSEWGDRALHIERHGFLIANGRVALVQ